MSCSPFDLRDFLLDELPAAERRQVELHAAGCGACREDLERLRLTMTALRSVPDEEPPRRLAFVSDKVFEPRWWQVWNLAPKLTFASALIVSASLLVHAFARPVPVIPTSELQARVEAEVSRRMAAMPVAAVEQQSTVAGVVRKAVETARHEDREEAVRLVQAAEKRFELQRRDDQMAFDERLDYMGRQLGLYRRASLEQRGLQ